MGLTAILAPHAAAVIILSCIALVMFSRDEIPLETSSLMILAVLVVGFFLYPFERAGVSIDPYSYLKGFGHPALITIVCLMVIGQALVRTGAMEPIGRLLAKMWRKFPRLAPLIGIIVAAILSAFVNNTPVVILILPILINVSLRTGASMSGVLLPIGLVTIVGGMATTIGTSTNLLVVGMAADLGMHEMSMFEFSIPVLMAGSIAVLYLWLIAPILLKNRQPPLVDISPRVFSAQLRIKNESIIAGKTLAHAIEKSDGAINVRRILRGKVTLSTLPDVVLEAGDQLLVVDTPDQLREFATVLEADLFDQGHILEEGEAHEADDQHLAEVVITAGSSLEGRRLANVHLYQSHRLRLLAFHRGSEKISAEKLRLDKRVLRAGDILLVQASEEDINHVKKTGSLLVLDGGELIPKIKRAKTSLTVIAGVVLVSALGILPIMMSALIGVLIILLTGCLNWRDIGQAVNTQVILVIVTSLALGKAMMDTGAADFIAQLYVAGTWGLSPPVILGGLMLMMAILTNLVSNTAAALVGTPIGISIAQQLGLPIEAFVLAVLFGANMSFATPMAYQTNLLVMNAGGYKFSDFIKVGVPLIVILWLSLTYILKSMYF